MMSEKVCEPGWWVAADGACFWRDGRGFYLVANPSMRPKAAMFPDVNIEWSGRVVQADDFEEVQTPRTWLPGLPKEGLFWGLRAKEYGTKVFPCFRAADAEIDETLFSADDGDAWLSDAIVAHIPVDVTAGGFGTKPNAPEGLEECLKRWKSGPPGPGESWAWDPSIEAVDRVLWVGRNIVGIDADGRRLQRSHVSNYTHHIPIEGHGVGPAPEPPKFLEVMA